jgi:two-component system chemotaxis response regulator CheY
MALNVLIVDDSPIVRSVVEKTLRVADLPLGTVLKAANGQEALDGLADSWMDLIFADIHMPVMDGMQLVEALQADQVLRTIPVVIVSTEGSTTRMEELINKGVKAYLRKPITPEQLRRVVEDVVGYKLGRQVPQTVTEVFSDVMERMAFTFPQPIARDKLDTRDDVVLVHMAFSGAMRGDIQLALTRDGCREIAANILGVPADDPQAEDGAEEALKEMLNVTCGRILTSLAGDEPVFDLSIPEQLAAGSGDWQRLSSHQDTMAFLIEDQPALLRLLVHEEQSLQPSTR